jgi:hypothetical protein
MEVLTVWLVALGVALVLGVLIALAFRYHRGRRHLLEKIPVTDREKREAVELTLRGVMFCVLGLLFAPLVLLGLVPLYYGLRKLALASMGIGLLGDPRDGSV